MEAADVVARGECIGEKMAVSFVLSQINHIIERFHSDDTEEEFHDEYIKLRQKILKWYYVIEAQPEINDQY